MTMEYDLILMSLCIFVPSIFALGLLFFPKGTEEGMRWWSLVGTAVTFVLSTFVFINCHQMLDGRPDGDMGRGGIKRADRKTTLLARAETSAKDDFDHHKAPDGGDLQARYPWIDRFNIEYYIGIDG